MVCRAVQGRPDRFKLVGRSFRNANRNAVTVHGSTIRLDRL